jgi:catechol 2,3-dioxygenase-like lactoylglutathione lyase family enzyme
MAVSFDKTIPILRIFDVEEAKDFYAGFLGFAVAWEHHFDESSPAYIQVARGGLTLHLSEHLRQPHPFQRGPEDRRSDVNADVDHGLHRLPPPLQHHGLRPGAVAPVRWL